MTFVPRAIPEMPAIDRFNPGTMADGAGSVERRGYVYAAQALSARPETFTRSLKRALVTLHNDSVWGSLEPPLDDILFSKTREALVRIDSGEMDLADPDRIEAVQIFLAQVVDHGLTTRKEPQAEADDSQADVSRLPVAIPIDEHDLDRMITDAIARRDHDPAYRIGEV